MSPGFGLHSPVHALMKIFPNPGELQSDGVNTPAMDGCQFFAGLQMGIKSGQDLK